MDEETIALYILNEKNIQITKEYIESTLNRYSVKIKIKDITRFQQAMVHTSYMKKDIEEYKAGRSKTNPKEIQPIKNPNDAIPLQEKSYERLEFLGDAVIHCILADYLSDRYSDEDEGFMTRLRTKVENGDTLATLSKAIGLPKYVLISRFLEETDGRETNMALMEDAFEAFIGALYRDQGFDICRQFVIRLVEAEVNFSDLLYTETNFKDCLLRYFHQQGWEDPTYGQLDVSGPEHKKMFTMFVMRKKHPGDKGENIGIGTAASKKGGEQEAAHNALKKLGQIINDDSDEESC